MNKIKLFFVLLSVVAVSASGQNLSISGKVTDTGTGEGLAYVYIQVKSNSTAYVFSGLTDKGGDFIIKNLIAGNYVLSVSSLGYYTAAQEVRLGDANQSAVKIEMKPALIPLGEVEVSSLRYNKLERDVALPVTVV